MVKPRFRLVPYRLLPFIDWPLIAVTIALLACGLITLWGATSGGEGAQLWPIPFYVWRQLLFAAAGLALAGGLIGFDYRRLRPVAWALYGLLVLALAGLLIQGATIRGSASWYDFGLFKFQPSEPGKIILVVALARYLADRMLTFRGLRHALVPLAIVGGPMLLILAQNDLGTALVLVPVAASMFWVAGLRKRIFVLFLVLGIGAITLAYPHLKPHQQERIRTFIHPEADLRGSGWNIFQAKTTLGSGELTGRGWGRGTQTQFRFLPEFHTDFIFPTVGEQFGLVGCLTVIALFALFIWRLIWLATRCEDLFGVLILTGLAAMLVTHIVQNIGMVLGLLPITGLPLPFFSYGGSFLLTALASVGLALSIGARRGL
jgi:rod shape determining protein RodA